MLEQIFLRVLSLSKTASIVMVVVFFVRILLKRFPKNLSYMLWSVVLFRLLCPVSLELSFSPVSNLQTVFYEYTMENDIALPEALLGGGVGPHIDGKAGNAIESGQTAASPDLQGENVRAGLEALWPELLLLIGKYVWLSGMGFLFLYCAVSVLRVRGKVSRAIPLKENIYMVERSMSPFVMGLFRPRIYLPEGLGDEEQEYIILHERVHIRRMDHIVKPLAFAALCIHWFNPLVWIAFDLFCKDMEMSCDEAVISKMGEHIKADYSASLLAISAQRPIVRGIPVTFGEGDTMDRIKNLAALRRSNKGVTAVLFGGVIVLVLCLAFNHKSVVADADHLAGVAKLADNQEITVLPEEQNRIKVSLDITEHYITNTGDSSLNLYAIDEDGILWGCGRNEYGQLGQGTQDYEYHDTMVKIAENVVHVDYSQQGFTIFLTTDHKLYGMGNAGCGALQQYDAFDWGRYANGDHYYISEPQLLMENVVYACCGRDDIVCLAEDGTVWTWGTIYAKGQAFYSSDYYFIHQPEKILDNAVLVTGGWFNHAALLRDGTVWTWGDNSAGNCGVAEPVAIGEPIMVAEDVVMVWTGYMNNTVIQNNIVIQNNTVIQKADGSRWICGENVGTEEKVVHGMLGDYTAVCTHEFYPLQEDSPFSADAQENEGTIEEHTIQELEGLMTTFCQAYFSGDIDVIGGLLIDDFAWDIEVYEAPEQADQINYMQIKGLQQIDEKQLLDRYTLSMEFQIPDEDSLTYLSVTWNHAEGAWKVSGYGLEK